MKVTFIPIVIGALGTATKGLIKGLEKLEITGRVLTTQTTTLLRTARILRRVLETCYSSNFSEILSDNTDVKNSQEVNNNNNNINNNPLYEKKNVMEESVKWSEKSCGREDGKYVSMKEMN